MFGTTSHKWKNKHNSHWNYTTYCILRLLLSCNHILKNVLYGNNFNTCKKRLSFWCSSTKYKFYLCCQKCLFQPTDVTLCSLKFLHNYKLLHNRIWNKTNIFFSRRSLKFKYFQSQHKTEQLIQIESERQSFMGKKERWDNTCYLSNELNNGLDYVFIFFA